MKFLYRNMKSIKKTLGRKWRLQTGKLKADLAQGSITAVLIATLLAGCGQKDDTKEDASQLTPPQTAYVDIVPEEETPESQYEFLADQLGVENVDLVNEEEEPDLGASDSVTYSGTSGSYTGGSGNWYDGSNGDPGNYYVEKEFIPDDGMTQEQYAASLGLYTAPDGSVWTSKEAYLETMQGVIDEEDNDYGTGDGDIVVTPEPDVTPLPEEPDLDLPQDENGDYYESEEDLNSWVDAEKKDETTDGEYRSPYDGQLWRTQAEHDAWYAEHPEEIPTNDDTLTQDEEDLGSDQETSTPQEEQQQDDFEGYTSPYDGGLWESQKAHDNWYAAHPEEIPGNVVQNEAAPEAQSEIVEETTESYVDEAFDDYSETQDTVTEASEVDSVIEELPSAGTVTVTSDNVTTTGDVEASIESTPVETYSEPAPAAETYSAPAAPAAAQATETYSAPAAPAPAPAVETYSAPAETYSEPAPEPEPAAESNEVAEYYDYDDNVFTLKL